MPGYVCNSSHDLNSGLQKIEIINSCRFITNCFLVFQIKKLAKGDKSFFCDRCPRKKKITGATLEGTKVTRLDRISHCALITWNSHSGQLPTVISETFFCWDPSLSGDMNNEPLYIKLLRIRDLGHCPISAFRKLYLLKAVFGHTIWIPGWSKGFAQC